MPQAAQARRGTSSCHECRRRKVRCDYDPESSSSCTPCQRRGRECMPQLKQAFDYGAGTSDRYRQVRRRLVHLEALVDQLLQQPGAAAVRARAETFVGGRRGRPGAAEILASRDSSGGVVHAVREATHEIINRASDRTLARVPATGSQTAIATNTNSTAASLDALTRLLRSLFPPQETVFLIVARGNFAGSPLRQFQKAHGFIMEDVGGSGSSSQETHLDMIPSPTAANPLVLARKLVELAIYLQQLGHDDGNGPAHSAAAACFVDAASRHVTSRTDNLLCCLDGIELLMLEGVYHVNAGDWRRGWQEFRRALRIACAMGLGRPRDGANCDRSRWGGGMSKAEEGVWFRLVYSDRYMSMILGLPPAVTNDGALGTMDTGTQLRRLERVHAIVTGRIALRNEQLRRAGFWDGVLGGQGADTAYRETLQIDDEMKQAVLLVSAGLWALPAVSAADSTTPPATAAQVKEITPRLLIQVKHFNLLVLLHFPYLMRSLDDRKSPRLGWTGGRQEPTEGCYSYSRLTAVHASREVLSRFLMYRTLGHVPLFSRGFDFMAVTAAVVLLLSHLDDHCLGRGNVLEHQRPGDLHMLACVAACFEAADAWGTDPLSRSAAQLLRTLAGAESDAAQRLHEYLIWREDGPVGQMGYGVAEEPNGLRLTVPHFGIIHVVRREKVAASATPGLYHGLGVGRDEQLFFTDAEPRFAIPWV
ncbi:uncharacterized protein B0T15DRAFT_530980 [Chaetomium strumarium]|uniref:Zn(2)-C6 fungal-type domain-containing protein n=1 Tax=Chaetomium strumarium TaxID=1170767 RepID=A0AAJ0GX35_9PEZI|nr:hypothetical protein B0T15DRAFT_530980 [Chaetomium strumarium]